MAERCTKYLKNQRINFCVDYLVLGYTPNKIVKLIGEKKESLSVDFNLNESMIRNYITAAYKRLEERDETKIEYYRNRSLKRYDDLYVKASSLKDIRTCKDINKETDTLLGLNNHKQVIETVNPEGGFTITLGGVPQSVIDTLL